MELKTKLLLGAGVIATSALAFSVYRTVKRLKMEEEETQKLLDELEEKRLKEEQEKQDIFTAEEVKMQEELQERQIALAKQRTIDDKMNDEIDEERISMDSGYLVSVGDEYEGDDELRFPPNSQEAYTQYKAYRLSDFPMHSDIYTTLYMLFDFEYNPMNDKDRIISEHIREERMEFFGEESDWTAYATIAEVYLHFIYMLSMDLDRGLIPCADHLLITTEMIDQGSIYINTALDSLMRHQFKNSRGEVGLFGLLDIPQNYNITFMEEYWAYCNAELETEAGDDAETFEDYDEDEGPWVY